MPNDSSWSRTMAIAIQRPGNNDTNLGSNSSRDNGASRGSRGSRGSRDSRDSGTSISSSDWLTLPHNLRKRTSRSSEAFPQSQSWQGSIEHSKLAQKQSNLYKRGRATSKAGEARGEEKDSGGGKEKQVKARTRRRSFPEVELRRSKRSVVRRRQPQRTGDSALVDSIERFDLPRMRVLASAEQT